MKKDAGTKAEVREGEEPEVLPTLTMQFDSYTNCYVLVDEHGIQRALLRPAGESAVSQAGCCARDPVERASSRSAYR